MIVGDAQHAVDPHGVRKSAVPAAFNATAVAAVV
jgi:hypothetical protein